MGRQQIHLLIDDFLLDSMVNFIIDGKMMVPVLLEQFSNRDQWPTESASDTVGVIFMRG